MAASLAVKLTGGAANAAPASSLGGAKSSTTVTDNAAGNLWRTITDAERTAGIVLYRAVAIENTGNQDATSTKVWVDTEDATIAGVNIDIGLDTAAAGGSLSQTIANEQTAPTGVTFSRPSSYAAGLSIGTLNALGGAATYKGLWVRLTVDAGATAGTDTPSFTVQADTAP